MKPLTLTTAPPPPRDGGTLTMQVGDRLVEIEVEDGESVESAAARLAAAWNARAIPPGSRGRYVRGKSVKRRSR